MSLKGRRRRGLSEQTGEAGRGIFEVLRQSPKQLFILYDFMNPISKKCFPPTDSLRSCHHCEGEASLPTAHITYRNKLMHTDLYHILSLPSNFSDCELTHMGMDGAYSVFVMLVTTEKCRELTDKFNSGFDIFFKVT